MKEKEKMDILEEYKEALAVQEDEGTFINSFYKLSKINNEMGAVMDLFTMGDVKPYEALVRLDALLELVSVVRGEIKEKL